MASAYRFVSEDSSLISWLAAVNPVDAGYHVESVKAREAQPGREVRPGRIQAFDEVLAQSATRGAERQEA